MKTVRCDRMAIGAEDSTPVIDDDSRPNNLHAIIHLIKQLFGEFRTSYANNSCTHSVSFGSFDPKFIAILQFFI